MKTLIVEDEIKLSDILLQGFEEQGMAVDVARNGDAGLQAAMDVDLNEEPVGARAM